MCNWLTVGVEENINHVICIVWVWLWVLPIGLIHWDSMMLNYCLQPDWTLLKFWLDTTEVLIGHYWSFDWTLLKFWLDTTEVLIEHYWSFDWTLLKFWLDTTCAEVLGFHAFRPQASEYFTKERSSYCIVLQSSNIPCTNNRKQDITRG